jgi:hypothetical protein
MEKSLLFDSHGTPKYCPLHLVPSAQEMVTLSDVVHRVPLHSLFFPLTSSPLFLRWNLLRVSIVEPSWVVSVSHLDPACPCHSSLSHTNTASGSFYFFSNSLYSHLLNFCLAHSLPSGLHSNVTQSDIHFLTPPPSCYTCHCLPSPALIVSILLLSFDELSSYWLVYCPFFLTRMEPPLFIFFFCYTSIVLGIQ